MCGFPVSIDFLAASVFNSISVIACPTAILGMMNVPLIFIRVAVE